MSLLWNRNWAVTFGKRGKPGTKVTRLRTNFAVERNSESTSNPAKVSIYNLNADSRKEIEKADEMVLLLEVGYGKNLDQLFYGDIENAVSEAMGGDIVTVIETADGRKALEDAKIDKSYKEGTSYKKIVNDLAESFKDSAKVAAKTITAVKDEITQNGISASGLSKKVLDEITAKQDLEWSIQNNELQILEKNTATNDTAIVISPGTGLIGKPKRSKEGIEILTLIQTGILPGRKIKLLTDEFDNFFKVQSVKVTGDTHGPSWYMACVCQDL